MKTITLTDEQYTFVLDEIKNRRLTIANEVRLTEMAIKQARHNGSEYNLNKQKAHKRTFEKELRFVESVLTKLEA